MISIGPSILSANLTSLKDEILAIERAGADFIHIDVMDGHFVPNLTFGPPVIQAIKKITKLPLDVHLMISNAESYLETYINSGADSLIIHVEAIAHLERAISLIKKHKIKAGVSLNPATCEHSLYYIVGELDLILVMSVNPGFSGQSFIPSTVGKIEKIKQLINSTNNSNCIIQVDGGIDSSNIKGCFEAGARSFVSGSFIFSSLDYKIAIQSLRDSVS